MNLEEIKAALAIKYNFTAENWSGKQARNDLEDMALLVAEVERLRADVGMNDVFRAEIDLRINDAEKAETEIWRLENTIKSKNPKKWEFKTWVDKCTKAEAEVLRLREAIKDLNALRRNDQQLLQDIEAKYIKRIQKLEEMLKEARR